jgi:hypothetical protein
MLADSARRQYEYPLETARPKLFEILRNMYEIFSSGPAIGFPFL